MRKMKFKEIRKRLSAHAAAFLALTMVLSVGLACSFNVGETGPEEKKSEETKTEGNKPGKKSVLSDEDAAIMKSATDKKSSRRSGAVSENSDDGDFIPVYAEVSNERYAGFNQKMKQEGVIEDITDSLNQSLALPTDVRVTFRDCGKINAWYQPDQKTITFCYEFMEFFYDQAVAMGKSEEEANQMMIGSTLFFFFHELGHCLIDVYDLPSTGREEDAVDQLSTYVLMDSEDEYGETSAISGVMMFSAMSRNEQLSDESFADEHSLNSQRAYNLACWIYGRNPEKFAGFVEAEFLPEARAVRCPAEYQKMSSAWQRLTDPWVKK
ncbi:MAG: DUF4344 domain-containing metallopeptidase [Pyrinomonadaceae bacterium]